MAYKQQKICTRLRVVSVHRSPDLVCSPMFVETNLKPYRQTNTTLDETKKFGSFPNKTPSPPFSLSFLQQPHLHSYDKRYYPSCLLQTNIGDELHTFLHCPHSSLLSQLAIGHKWLSLILELKKESKKAKPSNLMEELDFCREWTSRLLASSQEEACCESTGAPQEFCQTEIALVPSTLG